MKHLSFRLISSLLRRHCPRQIGADKEVLVNYNRLNPRLMFRNFQIPQIWFD
jgi:hypothetical protein